jgi:hypothetical protein
MCQAHFLARFGPYVQFSLFTSPGLSLAVLAPDRVMRHLAGFADNSFIAFSVTLSCQLGCCERRMWTSESETEERRNSVL